MRFFKKISLFLPLLFLLWFCRKPTVASWDVDVVLPVVTSQLNIKNFFGDSVFKSDNTGLLNLVVTRTITAITLDSLIEIPDTTISKLFGIPAPTYTLAAGDSIPDIFLPPSQLTFSVGNDAKLKTLDIRTGMLTVKYKNNTDQPLSLKYVVPSATKNGKVFTIIDTIPSGAGFGTVTALEKNYDLRGYHFNLLSGNNYNTIDQNYKIKNVGSATSTISFGQGAAVDVSYKDLVPNYIDGYFGKTDIDIPLDTTRLDIIKTFTASNFSLSDGTFIFKILNEFGCEFTGSFNNIQSINGTSIVPLNTNQLANLNINSSTRAGGDIIFPSVRTISLTGANSNVLSFLSNLPEKLTYQGKIKVNPNGNWGFVDYAYYNTGIKVLADINIPLKFTANYFKLASTTKIDFANVTQLDNVNHGRFVISASNGYPFAARLQAFLIDKDGNSIDSLFVTGENTIKEGQLDGQNMVIAPFNSSLYINLDQAKIDNLKKAEQIRIETRFIMPPNPPDIKIYENYAFDINIVAELNYRAQRK